MNLFIIIYQIRVHSRMLISFDIPILRRYSDCVFLQEWMRSDKMVGGNLLRNRVTGSLDTPQDHSFVGARLQKLKIIVKSEISLQEYRHNKTMGRICVLVLLAVCALWTFGETLSCDQCGQECVGICGTRQFRACCFNNMRKRNAGFGLKFWMRPRRYAVQFYRPAYDA